MRSHNSPTVRISISAPERNASRLDARYRRDGVRLCGSELAAPRYGSPMPTPVEIAVQTYIRASGERDPAARAKLIEACFAEDGRFVTRSGVIRGRAGVDAMIGR